MSIEFSCECGKRFKVRDELAGRKGKCDGCGAVLQIPALVQKTAAPKVDSTLPKPFPAASAKPQAAGMGAPAVRSGVGVAVSKPAVAPVAKVQPVAVAKAPAPVAVPVPEPEPDGPTSIYDVEDPVVEEPVWTVQRGDGPEDPDFADEPAGGTATVGGRRTEELAFSPLGSGGGRLREWFYLLIGLALVPLVFSSLGGSHESELDRVRAAVHAHPEVERTVADMEDNGSPPSIPAVVNLLPGHKVDGAFLGRDSETHWLFALLAIAAFFAAGIFLLPRSPTKPQHAFYTGLFTGTAGVLLLLTVQLIAHFMRGRIVVPRSVIGLIFLLFKGIQVSYDLANDPDSGFIPSAIGFTLGVGLCEELCKALPILWHFRTKGTLDWRAACVWGFLSGAGFGVAEAIMYCGDFYNGIEGGDVYLVRFVSCIALHGIWAAGAAIFISRHPMLIQNGEEWWNVLLGAAALVSVPMVLHGLYDTMLKKEMPGAALVVAIISFFWLIYQIEKSRRMENSSPPARAMAR